MEQNQSEEIVGFSRPDATNLLGLLPNAGGESIGQSNRPSHLPILGRTSSGIAANSAGQVTLYYPDSTSWTLGIEVWDVFNFGTAIPPNSDCIVHPVDGRWLAIRIC